MADKIEKEKLHKAQIFLQLIDVDIRRLSRLNSEQKYYNKFLLTRTLKTDQINEFKHLKHEENKEFSDILKQFNKTIKKIENLKKVKNYVIRDKYSHCEICNKKVVITSKKYHVEVSKIHKKNLNKDNINFDSFKEIINN